MDGRADARHDQEHEQAEGIEAQGKVDGQAAHLQPGEVDGRVGAGGVLGHQIQAEKKRDEDGADRDEGAVARVALQEQRNQNGREQRQEEDEPGEWIIHGS